MAREELGGPCSGPSLVTLPVPACVKSTFFSGSYFFYLQNNQQPVSPPHAVPSWGDHWEQRTVDYVWVVPDHVSWDSVLEESRQGQKTHGNFRAAFWPISLLPAYPCSTICQNYLSETPMNQVTVLFIFYTYIPLDYRMPSGSVILRIHEVLYNLPWLLHHPGLQSCQNTAIPKHRTFFHIFMLWHVSF